VGILLFEMVAVILPIVLKASETFDKQGLPGGPCHPSALQWHFMPDIVCAKEQAACR
jgi:hypothetical protein